MTITEHQNRIEYTNIYGQIHRTDGPARMWKCGDNHWFIRGILHRVDGAAIEMSSGEKMWIINGKEMNYEEFFQHPLVMKHNRLKKRKETIKKVLDS